MKQSRRGRHCLFFLVCVLAAGFLSAVALAEEVKLGDYSFPADTVDLTLNGLTLPGAAEVAQSLKGFPKLKTVHMIGCKLTREDMRTLLSALPQVKFEWIVKTNFKEISSLAEAFDFGKRKVKDLDDFTDALSCLPNLKRIDTYQSTFPRTMMEELWQTYPDKEFGWTLVFGTQRVRTDATAFSMMNTSSSPRYKSNYFESLKYCKNLLALDLGHNYLQDISFVKNFPHLKVLILADNHVADISPLAELKELEYVELFKNSISDISPLADHTHLLDLNLCGNRLAGEDVTPLLTNTSLQRLWIANARLDEAQQKTLREGLPNCQISFTAGHPTSEGWRDHERYDKYRQGFRTREYVPFDGTEKPRPPKE